MVITPGNYGNYPVMKIPVTNRYFAVITTVTALRGSNWHQFSAGLAACAYILYGAYVRENSARPDCNFLTF